jgi:hypothetical protein
MVRALRRNEHNVDERDLLLDVCERAMKSRNPGESASMARYRDAIAAGRRIKNSVIELEVEDDT